MAVGPIHFVIGAVLIFIYVKWAKHRYSSLVNKAVFEKLFALPPRKNVKRNGDYSSCQVNYHANKVPDNLDAIVIGSGVGGLTCASVMAHAGKRVLVLEQHDISGGCLHVFKDKGFEFDTGIHYIGSVMRPDLNLHILTDTMTDGAVEWTRMDDAYDVVVVAGKKFNMRTGPKEWVDQMEQYFPGERPALERYVELCKKVNALSRGYFGSKILPSLGFGYAILNWILKVTGSKMGPVPYLKWSERTVADVLKELFPNNAELRGILSYIYGDYGVPPGQAPFGVHAMVVAHYHHGAAYPTGGPQEIAKGLTEAVQRRGGAVLVRARVENILIENGAAVGVTMANGDVIRAPMVISGAGIYNTFERLISLKDVPQGAQEKIGKILSHVEHGVGHFYLFVGLDKTAKELKLPAGNYWILPQNVVDLDVGRAEWFKSPDGDMCGCFASFPAAKDPTYEERFPGTSTAVVVAEANYEWFKKWENTLHGKRTQDYKTFKDFMQNKVLDLLETQFPQIKGHIKYIDSGSPLTNNYYLNSPAGESYGTSILHTRFTDDDIRPETPIQNLYLTGQDVCVVGYAGAMVGGLMTACVTLKRNLFADMEDARRDRADLVKANGSASSNGHSHSNGNSIGTKKNK